MGKGKKRELGPVQHEEAPRHFRKGAPPSPWFLCFFFFFLSSLSSLRPGVGGRGGRETRGGECSGGGSGEGEEGGKGGLSLFLLSSLLLQLLLSLP